MKKRILSLVLVMVLVVSMGIPVWAAETAAVEPKDVKITANYGNNYTYTYTIPNVLKTTAAATADKDDKERWNSLTICKR